MTERRVGDRYLLEREIGRGGMGTIWVAHDQQLRRRVALKLMSAEQLASESSRERFQHEATAIAQLRNPHVVQVYDYGIDDGAPYIVMELLEGEDLEARLRRLRRLPLAAVVSIVAQAAKALGTAHAAGIVHRDLKPANIFLASIESHEIVKLLDFGVAAMAFEPAVPGTAGKPGTLVGTPHYMSPEQARSSKNLDLRSDLWSLGVVAYLALTGELPFNADSLGELIVKLCIDPAPAASLVVPELGQHVDAFFERALNKDPARRFQSASEMAGAFAAIAEASRTTKPTKILMVDDEPDMAVMIRQRFRQQIRKSVYEFVFAGDGEAALEELRRHPDVDVILTDINMPRMDGLTFLRHVGEVNPLIKVVMVSAYGDMTNIREAMNLGAFDFLVKPLDFKDLDITLEKTSKHVRDLRKTLRSAEENGILRMFVNSGILERLVPMARADEEIASEAIRATVAFIDVCDFTTSADWSSPEAVVRQLNAIYEVIVPEVIARHGVIDKFMGDGVMAVFKGEHHIERALDTCVAIRAQLSSMAQRAGQDSPYAHGICVGVDSGEVVAANIGSRTFARMGYTAIGKVVHSAAHLESIAHKDQILIGESLHLAAKDSFECEPVGIRVLPEKREIAVYNVVHKILQENTTGSEPLLAATILC
jgi:class 3 adenylate cyclase/tRNA A-37 threonylcarbamoyl transferase component Bud32/ActR/RegA family two-component response regulator